MGDHNEHLIDSLIPLGLLAMFPFGTALLAIFDETSPGRESPARTATA